MPTINMKHLVDEIIANDGYYSDDPRVVKIVKYNNNWGGIAYGLIYEGQPLDMYDESDFIHSPEVIFEAKDEDYNDE